MRWVTKLSLRRLLSEVAGADTAIKVAQPTVLQPVDQAMHANDHSSSPGPLQDWRLANAPDALHNIEFGQTISPRLHVWFSRQIDGKAARQSPDWFQPMIGKSSSVAALTPPQP